MAIKFIRYGDGEGVEAICDYCGSENMSHIDDEWDGIWFNTGYSCDECGALPGFESISPANGDSEIEYGSDGRRR